MERGATADLFARPAVHYTRELLEAAPRMAGAVEGGLSAMASASPATLDQIDTPALVVDHAGSRRISRGWLRRPRRHGIRLRPHAKTHKSVWIARRQRELGAVGHTVAKLDEAEALIDGGSTTCSSATRLSAGGS